MRPQYIARLPLTDAKGLLSVRVGQGCQRRKRKESAAGTYGPLGVRDPLNSDLG